MLIEDITAEKKRLVKEYNTKKEQVISTAAELIPEIKDLKKKENEIRTDMKLVEIEQDEQNKIDKETKELTQDEKQEIAKQKLKKRQNDLEEKKEHNNIVMEAMQQKGKDTNNKDMEQQAELIVEMKNNVKFLEKEENGYLLQIGRDFYNTIKSMDPKTLEVLKLNAEIKKIESELKLKSEKKLILYQILLKKK